MVTGGELLDPLAEVLGDAAASALRSWAMQQRRTVRLTNPRWTARGYTDAVLAAIIVSTPGENDRQVIVKVCPPGRPIEETGVHRQARALSDADFVERHLVEQAYEPFPVGDGGRLMFQEVAAATLDLVPLSGVPDGQLATACAGVVDELIRRWGPTAIKSIQTNVGDYLHRETGRVLSTGGPADSVQEGLSLLPRALYLRDGAGDIAVEIPNPLLMFTDPRLAADLPIDAVVGLAHGDLHAENVLIPRTFGTPIIADFRLVDLSAFEQDAPVSRDAVTLMLSVIAPTVARLRTEEQEALLKFVLAPWAAQPRLSTLLADTLASIHHAGFEAIKSMQLGDWRSQYLLSVVATALQFTTFASVGDEGRWWFFRLAGRAGAEFLRRHGRFSPRGAVTLRQPVSWPEPATAAAPGLPGALDSSSRRVLAQVLTGLPHEVLRHAYDELVDASTPVTQPNWQDAAAVIRAVERDAEPSGAMIPLLVFADRLAHAQAGALGLRIHSWVNEVGGRFYAEDRLRDLCLASVADIVLAGSETSDIAIGDPDNLIVNRDIPPNTPGGSSVLAPSSVSPPPSETPVTRHSVRGGLPPRNPVFTGRELLLSLLGETLRKESSASVVPLHGLGGVGKTQLATEFAYRNAERYWLIWWIAAETPEMVRASFVELARRPETARWLNIPPGTDAAQTTALVVEALSTSTAPWLMVYDNVEDPEFLAGLMPSTPSEGTGHVIVTSRNTAGWVGRGDAIEVDVFERRESIELLQRHGHTISHSDANILADKLGDWPLALEQAANWHASTGMPVAEYLEVFDDNIADLLSEGKPIGYREPLYAYLKMVFGELRGNLPAAAELLEMFAFLGPEPVSVALLRAGRRGGLSPALSAALDKSIELNRAVRGVRRLGLARVDERQHIQVHRLVQLVLRDELAQARLERSLTNVRRLLAAANPGYPDDPNNWSMYAEIAPHVAAARLIDAPDDDARMVVVDLIRHYFVAGDYEASMALGESAVARWNDTSVPGTPGPGHELTLLAQRHLANACRLLGRTARAQELDTDTFERLRHDPRFGDDHEHTLYTAHNMGVNLRLSGDLSGALRMEQENVARHLRVLGADDTGTWRAQNNLAVSLRHLGRYAEAYTLDEEILRRRRAQAGDGDTRTLFCKGNLAQDHYGLGNYLRALELTRSVVPQYREKLDPRHRELLIASRTLTVALRKCGFYAESRDNAEENYRNHKARFGARHEYTLAAMVSYANALRCCGSPAELTEARTLLRDATDAYREVFTPEHPLTLASEVNLAVALRAAGDRAEARRLNENARERLTERVGAQHPYALAAAANLATDLALAGAVERAAHLSWATYELSVEERGADHPETLASALNAALDKMAADDDTGHGLYERTLADLRRTFGVDHPATLDAVRGRRADCDLEPPPT
ncbi:hypothetical protein GCM10012284_54650 [Mangrovihabitans endophyticus]|uniref:Tetratricopeptide repeat-containing protein n=2 Tax=Mangrovihabitans endophyticus TaxID=1751298 RepID=A0A8J3FRM5_9ACTN|nr:hypothetical protein GCM10012284_54650 [Mangrovihabitans endophyticus]